MPPAEKNLDLSCILVHVIGVKISGKSTKLGTIALWNILIIFKGSAKNNDALPSNRC